MKKYNAVKKISALNKLKNAGKDKKN